MTKAKEKNQEIEKKRVEIRPDECRICMEDIKLSTEKILDEILIKSQVHIDRMSEEWKNFLTKAENTLIEDIKSNQKKVDGISSNAKWILTIVMAFTFSIGLAFGILWKDVAHLSSKIEDLDAKKINIDDAMSLKQSAKLRQAGDLYYDSRYVHSPSQAIDSVRYNMLLDEILGEYFKRPYDLPVLNKNK